MRRGQRGHSQDQGSVQDMRQVSKKQAAINRARAKIRQKWYRQGRTLCEARTEACTYQAQDLHEVLPRGRGGDAADENNIIPVCRSCHDWIHAHTVEAENSGLLKRPQS
jgi:hypothetical protein